MTGKQIPVRTCAGCGTRKEKSELIRIVRRPDGEIAVDFSGKMSGRGVYLCADISCFLKAKKKKAISRALDTAIPDQVYQQLEESMKESDPG